MAFLERYKASIVEALKAGAQSSFDPSSGALRDSIKATPTEIKNDDVSFSIEMNEYAKFVDKGVKGADPSGIYKNNPDKTGVQRAPNSPYSFKSKMPPPSKLDKWGVIKGLAPRIKSGPRKGQFLPRRSLNFAVAKSIFHQGIKPTYFLTKVYQKYLTPEFETELMLQYSRDIDDQFKN